MKAIDPTQHVGKTFNKWTILEYLEKRGKEYFYLCECECGTRREVQARNIIKGGSKSCGCIQNHGYSQTPEYKAWHAMKQRCYNPNNLGFNDYGGRGVRVCERWLNDPVAFIQDMGPKPSPEHSLDKDVKGGVGCLLYSPETCSWQTKEQQTRHKRDTIFTQELADEVRRRYNDGATNTELAEEYGCQWGTIQNILTNLNWKSDIKVVLRRKNIPVDAEEVSLWMTDRENGMTMDDLSKKYGRSTHTLRNYLTKEVVRRA